ncbi:MAG: hypothetical protein U0325_09015 [Polyangiales bacterium]
MLTLDPSFGVTPPPFPRHAAPSGCLKTPSGRSSVAEAWPRWTATGDRDAVFVDAEATQLLALLDDSAPGETST